MVKIIYKYIYKYEDFLIKGGLIVKKYGISYIWFFYINFS